MDYEIRERQRKGRVERVENRRERQRQRDRDRERDWRRLNVGAYLRFA